MLGPDCARGRVRTLPAVNVMLHDQLRREYPQAYEARLKEVSKWILTSIMCDYPIIIIIITIIILMHLSIPTYLYMNARWTIPLKPRQQSMQ